MARTSRHRPQSLPFAKSVFVKKQVRYALTAAATADELLAELEQELALLAATEAEQLDTTLLIHPLAMTDFLDYHFFLAEAEALIRQQTVTTASSRSPAQDRIRNTNLLAATRTMSLLQHQSSAPHLMLHLLRESSIDRAVASFPTPPRFSSAISKRWKSFWLVNAGWKKLWLG